MGAAPHCAIRSALGSGPREPDRTRQSRTHATVGGVSALDAQEVSTHRMTVRSASS
jgi:hypothetical protein